MEQQSNVEYPLNLIALFMPCAFDGGLQIATEHSLSKKVDQLF